MAEYDPKIDWAEIKQQREIADNKNSLERYLQEQRDNLQRHISRQELRSQLKIGKGNWAVQREQIRSQLKAQMQTIKFEREQMRKIGIPEMEANRKYQEAQVKIAQQAHGLAKAQLGLDYLKFASTLSGPENYFQAANFYRGARATGGPASFLDALNKNVNVSAFQGTGGEKPRALSAQGIAFGLSNEPNDALGSGYGSQEEQDAANLRAIDNLTSRAGGSLAPNSLESLDENELALISSGGGALGKDIPRWLRDYQRARMGSESVLAA